MVEVQASKPAESSRRDAMAKELAQKQATLLEFKVLTKGTYMQYMEKIYRKFPAENLRNMLFVDLPDMIRASNSSIVGPKNPAAVDKVPLTPRAKALMATTLIEKQVEALESGALTLKAFSAYMEEIYKSMHPMLIDAMLGVDLPNIVARDLRRSKGDASPSTYINIPIANANEEAKYIPAKNLRVDGYG